METITYETLHNLLEKCISSTIESVQEEISGLLPPKICLELAGPGPSDQEASLEEVMSMLYINGKFPRIVDVAVRGITDECTLIWIRPSGHAYVSDLSDTWNKPPGMGPFKSIGLMLPTSVWTRPRPFSGQDLKDAADARKKREQTLRIIADARKKRDQYRTS